MTPIIETITKTHRVHEVYSAWLDGLEAKELTGAAQELRDNRAELAEINGIGDLRAEGVLLAVGIWLIEHGLAVGDDGTLKMLGGRQ